MHVDKFQCLSPRELCDFDDIATYLLLDCYLGFRTHKMNTRFRKLRGNPRIFNKVVAEFISTQDKSRALNILMSAPWVDDKFRLKGTDKRELCRDYLAMFIDIYQPDAGFEIQPCDRYSMDKNCGAKIVVTKSWFAKETISTLKGVVANLDKSDEESILVAGQNDFSGDKADRQLKRLSSLSGLRGSGHKSRMNNSGGAGAATGAKYVTYSTDVSVSKTEDEDESSFGGYEQPKLHQHNNKQQNKTVPNAQILENFAELVAAFERSVSSMNKQIHKQMSGSPKLPRRTHSSVQERSGGLPHAYSANWYATDAHSREELDEPSSSANKPGLIGGSQGNMWDAFGSMPRRSQSQRNPPRGQFGEEFQGDGNVYEGIGTNPRRNSPYSPAHSDFHRPIYPSSTSPNSGYNFAAPDYSGSNPYASSSSRPTPPPPPPRSFLDQGEQGGHRAPIVGDPRQHYSPYQLSDPSPSLGVKAKSKIAAWLPVKLVRRKRSKTHQRAAQATSSFQLSQQPQAGQRSDQRERSRSPSPVFGAHGGGGHFPSSASKDGIFGVPSQSTLNRRGYQGGRGAGAGSPMEIGGGVVGGVYSLGELAKTLKDAERQIARLNREQSLMSRNFEGSRKDVLALQTENEKLKRDYMAIQRELQTIRMSTSPPESPHNHAVVPMAHPRLQSSPQLDQIDSAGGYSSMKRKQQQQSTLSRDRGASYEAHLESPIIAPYGGGGLRGDRIVNNNGLNRSLGGRAGTPYSIANTASSSRDVLDHSAYSVDDCITPPSRVNQVQLSLEAPWNTHRFTRDRESPSQQSNTEQKLRCVTLCDDFEIKPDTGWAELDRKLEVLFHKLASTIDPESSLGLDFYTDVHCYSIGEIERVLSSSKSEAPSSRYSDPSILPYGYCIASLNLIVLKLNTHSSTSLLAIETCISKQTWDTYIGLLDKHKKVVFMGPQCVGKKYLSLQLAIFISENGNRGRGSDTSNSSCGGNLSMSISSSGKSVGGGDGEFPNVFVMDASKESEISFKTKLQNNFIRPEQEHEYSTVHCSKGGNGRVGAGGSSRPRSRVGVVLNIQLTSVASTLQTLNSNRLTVDYVILTMQTQNSQVDNFRLYKNFRWINLNTEKEPLEGLFGRTVNRRLVCEQQGYSVSPDSAQGRHVIKLWSWMEQFCRKVTKLVSKMGLQNVIRVGPSKFLLCPIDPDSLRTWTSNYWNREITPQLKLLSDSLRNDKECREVIDWVYQSFPWNSSSGEQNQLMPLFSQNDQQFDYNADFDELILSLGLDSSELKSDSNVVKTLTPGTDEEDPFELLDDGVEDESESIVPFARSELSIPFVQPESSASFVQSTSTDSNNSGGNPRIKKPTRPVRRNGLSSNNVKSAKIRTQNGNQGSEHESFSNEEF